MASVYEANSSALTRRAFRYLQDQQQAEDVVQEAFIKVLLAAPELNDAEHLIAYLNKTVTNLCLDIRRSQNRGPLLVAVDSETSADLIDDLSHEQHVELDDALTQAEDAAIVREAISRLSETDRAVLLSIHLENKTTAETAAQFGVTEGTVRNALMRARRNLRTVLEEWVIDEATGMTAAQYLSRTGQKIAENSKKIGSAALSLVLLVAAFFGFWNNPTTPVPVASAPKVSTQTPTVTPTPDVPATATLQDEDVLPTTEELQTWAINYLSKVGPLGWPGLDAAGLPVGFTVNDGFGLSGLALISQEPFVVDVNRGSVSTESRFMTFQDGINVILTQKFTNTSGRLEYSAEPLVRVGGAWIALEIASRSTEIKKLEDGTYLVTSWMIVDADKTAANPPIAGVGLGTDLANIPAVIATRMRTTEIGQPVIGQAVQVLDPLAGRS